MKKLREQDGAQFVSGWQQQAMAKAEQSRAARLEGKPGDNRLPPESAMPQKVARYTRSNKISPLCGGGQGKEREMKPGETATICHGPQCTPMRVTVTGYTANGDVAFRKLVGNRWTAPETYKADDFRERIIHERIDASNKGQRKTSPVKGSYRYQSKSHEPDFPGNSTVVHQPSEIQRQVDARFEMARTGKRR